MAVLHHDHEGHARIYVKGAPEVVLAMSRGERAADGGAEPLNPERWHHAIERLAADGQRVIAVASRVVPQAHTVLNVADVDGQLTLIGLVGLIDPPRQEAASMWSPVHGLW